MEHVHNSKKRRPAILDDDLVHEWMPKIPDKKKILKIAATQYPAKETQACTMAKDFKEVLEST